MSRGLLDLQELRRELSARVLGRRLEIHEELRSTNGRALQCTDEPDAHGLVVLAEWQASGRGRLARSWHSPKGASVLLSVLLRLDPHCSSARCILLWSALAACDAIEQASGVRPLIKWPNDLVVSGLKLAGILIESKPVGLQRAFVIGIGVNCLQHAGHFPPEIRGIATSLDMESPSAVDRLAVTRAMIASLDEWLERSARMTAEQIKRAWLERAVPLGTRLHLDSGGRRFSGRIIELDPEAGILMELEHGGRRLFDPYTTSVVASR